MNARLFPLLVLHLCCDLTLLAAADDFPAELSTQQPGVQLTLVAEQPAVVTPTGIDVDSEGRIWVVASHTHFRPDDYQGPEHDEVVVLSPDGERRTFYEQTDATMDLELGTDGWVYLAERDRILRVRDRDGDGVGDEEETLASLETEGTYPHNGLAGLAWHPDGDLLFSLGENFWKHWTLTAPDGSEVRGTGEGGVFRCDADGKRLRRIARGFWNPFGLCVREDGVIFAAENDPGARPPCRLLHIVEGGDYGYQRLYGSEPHHPFVCWNGELPGTLPMVHSVGEAPCGIVPLGNGVIVPSWTDNRIDFYPLQADGASFRSERVVLVQGGRNFRPTGITKVAPTVFYLADWVEGSYPIHGKGRLWKLEIDPPSADWLGDLNLREPTAEAELAAALRSGATEHNDDQLYGLAESPDPFVARAAIDALAKRIGAFSKRDPSQRPENQRITQLLAVRKAHPKDLEWVQHFWQDPSEKVKFETLRWMADEQLGSFADQVHATLENYTGGYRLFEALLATWNTLSGDPRSGVSNPEVLLAKVRDEQADPLTRAYALRLLDPATRTLTPELIDELLATDHPTLRREALRTLAGQGTDGAQRRLMELAIDEQLPAAIRADAIAGLATPSDEQVETLLGLAKSPIRSIRDESLRSIRFASLTPEQRERLALLGQQDPVSRDLVAVILTPETLSQERPDPSDLDAWQERLSAITQPVDVEAGRRIFQHASVGTCAKCHRRNGRGNVVGPDLSAVAQIGDSRSLLQSLLQPSRDVAPQYFPRALLTKEGSVFVGILLRDGGGGREVYRDSSGQEKVIQTADIESRRELKTSMMPEGLVKTMTDREIRDLLAYLNTADK